MPRILIVEDNALNWEALSRHLRRHGYDVVRATNGEEAVQMAHDADLILMDVNLPLMDGWDATRAIKQDNPTIPIIALTAKALPADRERSLQAGCDDYDTKPVNVARLVEKMQALLRDREREG